MLHLSLDIEPLFVYTLLNDMDMSIYSKLPNRKAQYSSIRIVSFVKNPNVC